MPSIILVNGPPKVGKTTFINAFKDACLSTDGVLIPHSIYISEVLITCLGHMMGIPENRLRQAIQRKDEPCELFPMCQAGVAAGRRMTPREALIWLSEECIKPMYGKEFFGHLITNRMLGAIEQHADDDGELVFLLDIGFIDEAAPIIREFWGDENNSIDIVQIRREGRSFENDSRETVSWADFEIEKVDRIIENRGSLAELKKEAAWWTFSLELLHDR